MNSSETLILGIDPGLERTGFAVISVGKKQVVPKDFGVFLTAKSLPRPERLCQIADDIDEIIRLWKPQILVIEKLVFMKNITNGLLVAEARGIIVERAARAGLQIQELLPTAIKKQVTGNGQASKAQMQKMVQILFRLPEIPQPDDAADALAIAFSGTTNFLK